MNKKDLEQRVEKAKEKFINVIYESRDTQMIQEYGKVYFRLLKRLETYKR